MLAVADSLLLTVRNCLAAYFPAYTRLSAHDSLSQSFEDSPSSPSSPLLPVDAPPLIDTMRRSELDHAKNELARSNDELTKLYERYRMLERTLRDTRDALKTRDSEIDRLRKDKERERERPIAAERRRTDAQGRDLYRRGSTASLSRDPAGSRSSTASDTSLSSTSLVDEERARARTADAYLTRTDTWSGAQVLQAVHDINSEILQFAAAATEACTFDRHSRPSSSRAIQSMHDTSARIGPNFARILANRDHSQDPILVQLALQGCLTLCITRALSSFCVGFPSKSDSLLHQIYHRMALAGTLLSLFRLSPSRSNMLDSFLQNLNQRPPNGVH